MKLITSVSISSAIPALLANGPWFGLEFVDVVAAETMKHAREAVSPGRGPGPHPHRPDNLHEDTGALRDAIAYAVQPPQAGRNHEARVFINDSPGFGDTSPSEYGLYLEVGWTTASGSTYRYPWLAPSADKAADDWEELAKARISHHLADMQGRLHRLGQTGRGK